MLPANARKKNLKNNLFNGKIIDRINAQVYSPHKGCSLLGFGIALVFELGSDKGLWPNITHSTFLCLSVILQ
jgi:hypothetical protein